MPVHPLRSIEPHRGPLSNAPKKHERCNVDTDTEKRWQSKRKRNAYRKCEVGAELGFLRSSRQPPNLSRLLITPFAFDPAATVAGAAGT